MKKKVVVIVSIIFVIIASWLLISYIKEYMYNAHIKVGRDNFQYKFRESFKENKWKLFVNDHYVSFVIPFEGYSKKEMKEHLENNQLIKCLYDEQSIRIYGLPWVQYESRYKIIYTLDGEKFHSYSDDIEEYKEDPEIKQRLDQLYAKYPKEELEKREKESWK